MDIRLLELLVCPVTKGPLQYDREKDELISRSARLAYPVRDGIPILLENEARTLTDEEIERLRDLIEKRARGSLIVRAVGAEAKAAAERT